MYYLIIAFCLLTANNLIPLTKTTIVLEQTIEVLRIVAITQLFMLVVFFIKRGKPLTQVLPAAAFCLSVVAYLLVDRHPTNLIYLYIIMMPAFALPYFFWLFSKSIFDDKFQFRPWMLWLGLGMVTALVGTKVFTIHMDLADPRLRVQQIFHHTTSIFFVMLAVAEALRNRAADLSERRLQFRSVFIALTAVIIVFNIISEIAFIEGKSPMEFALIHKLVIIVLTTIFAYRIIDFNPDYFKVSTAPLVVTGPSVDPEVDLQLIDQLKTLIEGEKHYRTEGLTIQALANKMDIKEYRLRQVINQHLGFRNFNEFLHSYRISEACDVLADPSKKERTVLEIAYDLGYKSIAPFNKAFKDITGHTPTEWRRAKTA